MSRLETARLALVWFPSLTIADDKSVKLTVELPHLCIMICSLAPMYWHTKPGRAFPNQQSDCAHVGAVYGNGLCISQKSVAQLKRDRPTDSR